MLVGIALTAAVGTMTFACGSHALTRPPPQAPTARPPYQGCLERKLAVADDATTPLGATTQDILRLALGEHQLSIHWRELSEVSHAGEGQATDLRVQLSRAKGEAVFVHSEPNPEPDPSGFGVGYICEDSLQIPVHMHAETRDGLLKLDLDTELVASDESSASLQITQLLATHQGKLQLTELRPPNLVANDFLLALGFTERGMSGLMRGVYESVDATAAMASYVDFTCFPEGLPPQEHGFSFPGCQD